MLLTRYDPARAARGEMLKTEDVLEILSIPLLGIIPESEEVLRASNIGAPVTLSNPGQRRRPAPISTRRGGCGARTSPMTVPGEAQGLRSASCSGGGWHEPVAASSTARRSAPVARERLQILLAHERAVERPTRPGRRCCRRRSWR